ncbi:MAG: SDR family NAD(P)-dependent oxidoreductase [Vulcanisaeta sp.]
MGVAKVAVVTGASSGIGRELSRELASRSYDLILVARNRDKLSELANELSRGHGVNAWAVAGDLSTVSGVRGVIEGIRGLGVRINVLVNNAGAGIYGPISEISDDDVVRVITLNYIAPILLTKGLLGDLVETRGCVVNVVSLAAYTPIPWFGIYTSSKAALSNMTDALRIELKPLGVRVIGVYPGYVKTNFHNNTITTPTTAKAREEPRGPILDPGYVAREVVKRIEDPGFNGDVIPGLTYSIAGRLARVMNPLVKAYIDKWFRKRISKIYIFGFK